VFWLLFLPLILIAAAFAVSHLFVRLSTLRITSEGIEIRNFPQAVKVVSLDDADRFVTTETSGTLSSIRPATATLVLTDGARVPVRSLVEAGGAYGVDELNRRLAHVRR
jgi:hypothetical protein